MNKKKMFKIGVLLVLSAVIQAFALNNFYANSGLLSAGLTGAGLIITNLTNGLIPLSLFLLIANIPLALLAYFNVGKRFTVLSFINIIITSLFLSLIPQFIVLDDILLNAIVGGVVFGLGVALALEAGASTGGTDFIALFISVKRQRAAGVYMLLLDGSIVVLSIFFFKIDIAVYTLISIYVCTKVIDAIHTRYQRVTLAIISANGAAICEHLVENGIHGLTILPAMGGYTKEPRDFIYTVVSTYEINDIEDMIFEIDNQAFVNVTTSQKIFGDFTPAKYD